jgi:hypothetical protein
VFIVGGICGKRCGGLPSVAFPQSLTVNPHVMHKPSSWVQN